jgi:hypothetical protein
LTVLAIVSALFLFDRPAVAQDPGGAAASADSAGPVSPDSADIIRDSLQRPPSEPPFGVLDAIALPFRVLVLPLRLVGMGAAELIGRATAGDPQDPPQIVQSFLDAGFRPGLGTIGPRSGVAATLEYWGVKPLFVEAGFSIRTSARLSGGFELQDSRARLLRAAYTFQRNAAPHFWGTGPSTPEDATTDYQWDQQRVAAIGRSAARRIVFTGELAWEDNRVDRSKGRATNMQDIPEFDSLYGVNERVRYLVANLTGTFDFTRSAAFQRRGLSFTVGGGYFAGVDKTDSDFYRVNLVLQGHIPLNPRQELAFQIRSQINRTVSGESVPFYHLARVGDVWGGRAYHQGRYRDNDMAAILTEWRYEVWRELHGRSRVESFFLFDSGQVQQRIDKIRWSDQKRSFGFGFRLITAREAFLVSYLALGSDGFRYRIRFGTTF